MNLFKRLKEKKKQRQAERDTQTMAKWSPLYAKHVIKELNTDTEMLRRQKKVIQAQEKNKKIQLEVNELNNKNKPSRIAKEKFGNFVKQAGKSVQKNLKKHSSKTRASFMNTGQSPLMMGGGGLGSGSITGGGINSLFNQPQATASKKKRKKKVTIYYE